MAVEISDNEARELYEVLNHTQRFIKHYEQMQAALDFIEKPDPYSPLTKRLMNARNNFGEKIAQLPQQGGKVE